MDVNYKGRCLCILLVHELMAHSSLPVHQVLQRYQATSKRIPSIFGNWVHPVENIAVTYTNRLKILLFEDM